MSHPVTSPEPRSALDGRAERGRPLGARSTPACVVSLVGRVLGAFGFAFRPNRSRSELYGGLSLIVFLFAALFGGASPESASSYRSASNAGASSSGVVVATASTDFPSPDCGYDASSGAATELGVTDVPDEDGPSEEGVLTEVESPFRRPIPAPEQTPAFEAARRVARHHGPNGLPRGPPIAA